MKISRLFVAIILAFSFIFIGCSGGGGGGSDTSTVDESSDTATTDTTTADTTTPTTDEIILADNASTVSVEEIDAIESIEGTATGGGELTLSSSASVEEWKADEVKILPPSDNMPAGMALKVVSVSTTSTGATVVYTTPTIDEVFQNTSFSINKTLSKSMIKSVNMRSGVGVSFGTDQAPIFKAGTWFPDDGTEFNHDESAVVDGTIAEINMGFESMVYEDEDSAEAIQITGDLNITDMNIAYSFEQSNVPFELKSNFNVTYDSSSNIKVEVTLEKSANIVDYVPEKFECGGLEINEEGDNYSVKISGAGFNENDICLGSVSLELSAIPVKASVGGDAVTDAPIGLRLFFIMGADMNIKIVSSVELSKSQYTDIGVDIDTTASEKIKVWSNEYVSKDDHSAPTWTKSIFGEMNGEFSAYNGVAAAPFILGIYPVVARAYGGPKLIGNASAGYNSESGLSACYDVDLDLNYGFDVSFNLGVELEYDPAYWSKINIDAGYSYDYATDGSKDVYAYNSCESDGYRVAFISTPTDIDSFREGNLEILDSSDASVTPESLMFNLFSDGSIIATNTVLTDLVAGLDEGTYAIEVIILIDVDKAIKTSITGEYIVSSDTTTSTGSLTIKKTGQAASYDVAGTEVTDGSIKDDGYYQLGVTPSYTRASDIVTDELTGLMWQDDVAVATETKPWLTTDNYTTCSNDTSSPACYETSGDTATAYCESLNLGGYTDWRLPTVEELDGIVDYTRGYWTIDIDSFENTASDYYWTSSSYSNHSSANNVYFAYGYTGNSNKGNTYYMRCVRNQQGES